MAKEWAQEDIQRYIDNEIEESLTLDYKSAAALGKSDGKKQEITKDVSAMANSAGGIILYGVKEYDEIDKRHLPEKIDGIDRTQYSKEWLEQVINTIQPRIDGLMISSVTLDTEPNSCVYIVKIPQSTTAHQARDWRYYKRFNFQSVAMYDYEVRATMSRAVTSNAEAVFSYRLLHRQSDHHEYKLALIIKNVGSKAIDNFKLQFTFPKYGEDRVNYWQPSNYSDPYFRLISVSSTNNGDYFVAFRSKDKLFPEDEMSVGDVINFRYQIDKEAYGKLAGHFPNENQNFNIEWILYADNMPPKKGEISLFTLQEF